MIDDLKPPQRRETKTKRKKSDGWISAEKALRIAFRVMRLVDLIARFIDRFFD